MLKAHDRSLDRIVAIKVMAPHLASSGSARKRFAREAKAAAAVLHPNVIAIHSVASEDANPYLVMPFVRGASLQKRIDSQGPLPLKDTLRIGSQIAAGLAAAHEQGLVHRDIKPANILLEEGVERVTITDFGLARAVDDASMTCSGVIAGTPQYMSPEQARGETIDARSDLFSLGSVLYAMCAGRSPFRAETTYGVLHRISTESPTSVCEVNSDVPVWLGHVIERLMAKRPDDRFGSAAQVAELLEGCLAYVQQPAAMPLPEAVTALAPTKLRRPPIGKSSVAMALAFAMIFVAAFMVLKLIQGSLTSQTDKDDVRVRITSGDKVVNELRVSKTGKSVSLPAGEYNIAVIGEADDATTETKVGQEQLLIILNIPSIQKELGLEDHQIAAIARIKANPIPTTFADALRPLNAILLEEQLKEFKSIAFQGLMVRAFSVAEVQESLNLTPDQKRAIALIQSNLKSNLQPAQDRIRRGENVNPIDLDRDTKVFHQKAYLEAMELLTAEQKEKWAEIARPVPLLNDAVGVVGSSIRPAAETIGLDSQQLDHEKDATGPIPPGAHVFGGSVTKFKFKSPGRPQSTVLENGDFAYEAAEVQNLANARIHLCKVTPAISIPMRYQVEVIQTISTNAEGRFAGFVPPEFTSLFERDPSAPYLALVVEAEGCLTESMSEPPEYWNHEMNFGLEPNEKPVRGQILVNGKPAGSVNVSVIGVQRANPEELDAHLKREGLSPIDVKEPRKQAFLDGPDPQPSGLMKTNRVLSVERRATDSQGKFELRGFGPNDVMTLEIEGEGVEKAWLRVINRDIEPIHLRHRSGHNETYYGCGFIYDQSQVDAQIDPTANDGTPSSAAMAKELDADARQAMSTHQNRLVWTNRFKFDSIRRYTHKEVGRVEERSTLASDGKRFVHRHESLKSGSASRLCRTKPDIIWALHRGLFHGWLLPHWSADEDGRILPAECRGAGWGMRERTSMMLEGYRAGNAGQTILELLLKSKDLEVKREKIGEVDCFRIKNRDEWGTHVAWIEAKGKNRLLQWESRKARGNKFSRSRQGEHRDTSNYESSGVRITGIEYREIDGTPIAIRGTYVRFDTPNGGQETVSSMEIERSNIELQPDFSSDSIFDPLYAEGARITDLDSTDPDKHFWWRNGQLVASD